MLRCTSRAAGGISHLLNPGPATVLSLARKLMTPSLAPPIRQAEC
jgi:hypothetical protein